MNVAILHYTLPPVVGGVEAVIHAHTRLLLDAGFGVSLVAGVGDRASLPPEAEFIRLPEMDSRHPAVVRVSQELEQGHVPAEFEPLCARLETQLAQVLGAVDHVIVHNVFTKHFNLPLTAALMRLLDMGRLPGCIAWCHDITWTSPHSRSGVHPGYPWDLLRTYRDDVVYVTVSRRQQTELGGLFDCPPDKIHVIYDGVDPAEIYGFTDEGRWLVDQLHLDTADVILLMPVRITQAKNIELALQVTAELKTRGFHPRLVVTGPPDPHSPGEMDYYHNLLDLRRRLGVEHEVRFVYECALLVEHTQPVDGGYALSTSVLRQLYRLCDALIVPSHREGFGMPILEAGLIGMPIFATDIPAIQEVAGQQVFRFPPTEPPAQVAQLILSWASSSPTYILRQRIRQSYTWSAIFRQHIFPLLSRGERP